MNAVRRIFDEFAPEYDRWFDENQDVYSAQLRILRAAVPRSGRGLEVGVGTGRFAEPLCIRSGIDPSRRLLELAKSRGIDVVIGEGEHLPFRTGSFDYVLMMTVLCFLDDPPAVFRESFRVLTAGGMLVAGFIEKDGEIATQYRSERTKGRFLRFARFRTPDEAGRFFAVAGFLKISVFRQERGFCVMTGKKPQVRSDRACIAGNSDINTDHAGNK